MIEKRKIHRRQFIPFSRFPLYTWRGEMVNSERRRLPTRRLNDIEVEELSIHDLFAKLH
jgi:hypothetical protein